MLGKDPSYTKPLPHNWCPGCSSMIPVVGSPNTAFWKHIRDDCQSGIFERLESGETYKISNEGGGPTEYTVVTPRHNLGELASTRPHSVIGMVTHKDWMFMTNKVRDCRGTHCQVDASIKDSIKQKKEVDTRITTITEHFVILCDVNNWVLRQDHPNRDTATVISSCGGRIQVSSFFLFFC